ncbi:hypothetical protein V7798_07510 [Rhizobium laguerreae]
MSVFISYSRKDIVAVKEVVDFLDKEFGQENIYFANREIFTDIDRAGLIESKISSAALFLNFDSINTYSHGPGDGADLRMDVPFRAHSALKASYYFLVREREAAIKARVPIMNILLSGADYLNSGFLAYPKFDLSADLNSDGAKKNLGSLVQSIRGIMDAQLFSR